MLGDASRVGLTSRHAADAGGDLAIVGDDADVHAERHKRVEHNVVHSLAAQPYLRSRAWGRGRGMVQG